MDNLMSNMIASSTTGSYQESLISGETQEFDFIIDGGWFENPLGDPASYQKLKNDMSFTEIDPIEHIEQGNDFFYDDAYIAGKGDPFGDTNAIKINDVRDEEISMIETSTPDGCKSIKIACLTIGLLVAFLFVWLIATVYLNTNKVVCKNEPPFCPPCPICPSSYSSSMQAQQFYIRDRITHHSLFNIYRTSEFSYLYSEKGDKGVFFIYDPEEKTLRVQPDQFFLYTLIEGGHVILSNDPYEIIDKNKYVNSFLVEGKTIKTTNDKYMIVKDGFLVMVDEESYSTTLYSQKIALFKENPNLILGI